MILMVTSPELTKLEEIVAPKIFASANCWACASVSTPWPVPCFAAPSSSRNSAKKIGICTRIGRQEANGLVPVSRYSFIVSWVSRSRSCPYFFCSSLTFGWSSWRFRLDLICLTNSGMSAARITTVRPTMLNAQEIPLASPKTAPKTLWKPTSTTEIR